ncbi:MAG: lipase family protein [Thiohalomonadales bacterium]
MTRSLYKLCSSILIALSLVYPLFSVHAEVKQADVTTTPQGMFAMLAQYAEFSSAIYGDKNTMQDVSQQNAYTLTSFGQIDGLKIRYLLATNTKSKTQLIAIRGTANVENALVDLALQLTDNNPLGIRLHDGFAQSALAVYSELKTKLRADYSISTTGHSLGGAVAVILAMILDKANYDVEKIVTFGQPKVTNMSGAKMYRHLSLLRVVTEKDMVPLLPPLDPTDIKSLDVYWHLGTEIVLLKGKQYALLTGMDSMLRALNFLNKQPSAENIHHHDIALYQRLVMQKIKNSSLITYETDFSFVGDMLNIFK